MRKARRENQVGLVRERFFTPRLKVKSYDDLNAWLVDKSVVWAKAHAHPEESGRTIWEAFEEERPQAHCRSRPLRRIPRAAGLGVEDLPAQASLRELAQAQLLCGSTTTAIR